jgi:hypothetical protein
MCFYILFILEAEMGLIGWFKGNKDDSSNLINLIEKAINKGRKGQWAPDNKLKEVITSLDLDTIDKTIIPYYDELSANEKGIMRKILVESGIIDVFRGYLAGKNRPKKKQVVRDILALKINPGTEELVELLADKDDEIKWLVTEILQVLQPKDGLELLLDKLQQPTKYPPARISEILMKYGDLAIDTINKEILNKSERGGYLIVVLGLMPIGKIYPIINEILKQQEEELTLKILDTLSEKDKEEFKDLPENAIITLKDDFEKLLNMSNSLLKAKIVKLLSKLPLVNYEILYNFTWDDHKILRLNAYNGLKKGNVQAGSWLEKIRVDTNHPLHDRIRKEAE